MGRGASSGESSYQARSSHLSMNIGTLCCLDPRGLALSLGLSLFLCVYNSMCPLSVVSVRQWFEAESMLDNSFRLNMCSTIVHLIDF